MTRRRQGNSEPGATPLRSGDPELDALFAAEPALLETARRVRAAVPAVPSDDQFRLQLRAQLLTEAAARPQAIQLKAARRRIWGRRAGTLPALFAGGGGLVLVAATVLILIGTPSHDRVVAPQAVARLANSQSVDASQAIEVSFNQPMDQAAVVAGLHLQPATAVSTRWDGNTLIIQPQHALVANTAYTVSIDAAALRNSSGTLANQPVNFSFGTKPTPLPTATPSPATTPQLQWTPLSGIANSTILATLPDGAVVVSAPDATGAATPTANSAAPATGVFVINGDGSFHTIAAATGSAAALSDDGQRLAVAVSDGKGGNKVLISAKDGTGQHDVLDPTTRVVAMTFNSNGDLEVVTAAAVVSVASDGQVRHIAAPLSGEIFTTIDPVGRFVVAGAVDHSRVIDISNGQATTLVNAAGLLVWSADGSTAAWLLDPTTAAVATAGHFDQPTLIPLSARAMDLAVNRVGSEVAVLNQSGTVTVVAIASQAVIATAAGPIEWLSFAPDRDNLVALLNDTTGGQQLANAAVATTDTGAPSSAAGAQVAAFVSAQVRGDSSAINALAAPGTHLDATPPGLSRGYVIAANDLADGSATAKARLLVDPVGGGMPRYADETMVLHRGSDGNFLVSSLAVAALVTEPSGPHVIHIATDHHNQVITIALDSDLDPTTVNGAVTVSDTSGASLPTSVSYTASTRALTVTLLSDPTGAVTVTLATSLHDIAGQALSQPYTMTVG